MHLYEMEGKQVPLCLTCSSQYQGILDRQFASGAAMINYLQQEMEMVTGVPGTRIAPPRLPATLQVGDSTLNNITISQSTVGALNVDVVGNIDNTVTLLRSEHEDAIADAIQKLTEGIANTGGVPDGERNDALEKLSLIADEAAKPDAQRRKAAIRPLVTDLSQWVSGIAALAQLWQAYGPALTGLVR